MVCHVRRVGFNPNVNIIDALALKKTPCIFLAGVDFETNSVGCVVRV